MSGTSLREKPRTATAKARTLENSHLEVIFYYMFPGCWHGNGATETAALSFFFLSCLILLVSIQRFFVLECVYEVPLYFSHVNFVAKNLLQISEETLNVQKNDETVETVGEGITTTAIVHRTAVLC